MTKFVFTPEDIPSVAIVGDDARFPVRRVWCIGRNYQAHAREMGHDSREAPLFFSKQPDMIVPGGGTIRYPSLTQNYHFEVELVIAIAERGEDVSVADAPSLVFGHAVGLDMTRRDLQKQMQEKGRPWEIAKSFEQSAPIAAIARGTVAMTTARISLSVNGETKQDSNISDMVWSVPEIISRLSQQVALAPGDLIFTGTPEGVGPVVKGDRLEAAIEGLETLRVVIA